MNARHLAAIWKRSFERFFQEYMQQGCGEDLAIALAERDAQEAEDRYVDEKLSERKEEQRTRPGGTPRQ